MSCGKVKKKSQWWFLSNYFGLSGYVCPVCHEKVSHDSYGKPRHPIAYKRILKKIQQAREEQ